MNSYQKLKAKNKLLEDKIEKLLSDPEYLTTELIVHKLKNELIKSFRKAIFFGDSIPTGIINDPTGMINNEFSGLFKKAIDESKS